MMKVYCVEGRNKKTGKVQVDEVAAMSEGMAADIYYLHTWKQWEIIEITEK